jgi:hypothetical protein
MFRKHKLVSLWGEIKRASEEGYEVAFTDIPKEAQDTFNLLADKRKQADEAQNVVVGKKVIKKVEQEASGVPEKIKYNVRCTTFGGRELKYDLAVIQRGEKMESSYYTAVD